MFSSFGINIEEKFSFNDCKISEKRKQENFVFKQPLKKSHKCNLHEAHISRRSLRSSNSLFSVILATYKITFNLRKPENSG